MTETVLRPALADAPRVAAAFTTRHFSSPDESLDAVRARLAQTLAMPVASVGQIHGADVAVVREPVHVPAHDGLVTDVAGLALTVVAADCVLVLLADPEAGVVGACHSGWRGTVAGVVPATIEQMVGLGADPGRIGAYVGPCISAEAFEVGEEVAAQFGADVVRRRPEWPRPHVDLRAEIGRQLAAAGVTGAEVSAGCTVREPDRFYSYRAEGGTRGRMLGAVGIRPA